MPSQLSYPLINGVRHDFSSIELKLAGQIFIGFRAINYNRVRTRVMVRGNSPDPIAKTEGTNEYTADAEIYLAEWNLFQDTLIQAASAAGLDNGGSGYGDVLFQVVVTYTSPGFDTIVDVLDGCSLDSMEVTQSQSADPLVRKFNLSPLKITYNTQDDLGTPLIGPPQ
jgi:hypothetical protein